ncbi:hypothetical protein [Pseudanabaena sp. BC1403]|uniref:hypothetical protein n=1 Tax=Pseudanabaena sp. BC1403 TaxID=2043171 RepID=UPI000CD962AF|nr:hypothetical protein [Pseudanabaena sp. BC1403]
MIIKDETVNKVKPYLLLTVLTLGIFSLLTKLWEYDFKIPMGGILGDSAISLFTAKNIADHGWYLNNENLAAPFGLEFYDFPMIEGFHFLLIKIINFLFSSQDYSYVIAFNIYFILGFVFASITTYIVAQKIKLPVSISIIISILYSFQYYHFLRYTAHYYLSAYYLVPISLLIMIWLINEEIFFESNHKNKFAWSNRSIACIILCLMISSSGAYYAIFTCFFVLIIAFVTFCKRKYLATLLNPLVVISTISFGFLVNLIPNFIYWFKEGGNSQIASRLPLEADMYSLKISQMLLPIQNHRFALLRWFRELYDKGFPQNQNEAVAASLGFFGSIGFLLLLVIPLIYLVNANRKIHTYIFFYLSILTYSTIFLAQTGGFGSLINLYISPQIRAYNRISIFVSLFALLSFGFLVAKLLKKSKIKVKIIFCSLILILGIYDQVPVLSTEYNTAKNAFIDDRSFVGEIEKQVDKGSMIYQLPYMFFPENPPPSGTSIHSYDLFRGYFHSNNLKWSFGALKGRNQDWHQWVNNLKLDEQLVVLASVGFQGIYVDTNGYDRKGRELEELKNNLREKLNVEPIISARQDLLFYNMNKYNSLYQEKYSNLDKDLWLHPSPLNVNFGKGFYQSESNSEMEWRWSSDSSVINIANSTNIPQELNLEITLQTTWSEKSELRIVSDLWTEKFLINNQPLTLRKRLAVPLGKYSLKFYSNSRQVDAPLDIRRMLFRVINSKFENPENKRRMDLLKKVSQELSESIKQIK